MLYTLICTLWSNTGKLARGRLKMWLKRPIALACLCLMVSCGPEGERVDPASIRVIDGDTIKLSGERLRLIGYDTPEASEPRCMGEKRKARIATRRLEDLLASGEVVRLARTGERDRYDRGLARLFIGASDVAELMVNEGLARTYNGGRRRAWC